MLSGALQRYQQIMDLLEKESSLETSRLPSFLGVTPMTVWRDLREMENRGMLRRLRGRIVLAQPQELEPDFLAKDDQNRAGKDRIAAWVVRHWIQEGEVLAMDGGTTVAALSRHPLPPNITIFTNSLFTASLFLRHPSRPMVYACGGLLRERSGTFIGRDALAFFSKRKTDKYFLSATGVDEKAGVSDLTLEDNEVKQVMAANSQKVALLADRSKWGKVSVMPVLPWSKIDQVVTDASREETPSLIRLGKQVAIQCV